MIIKKNLNKFIKISAVLLTGGILISGDSFKLREIFNSNCIVARAEDSKKEIGETFKTAINFYIELEKQADIVIEIKRLKRQELIKDNILGNCFAVLNNFLNNNKNAVDKSGNVDEVFIRDKLGMNSGQISSIKKDFDDFTKLKNDLKKIQDQIKEKTDKLEKFWSNYIEFCQRNSMIWEKDAKEFVFLLLNKSSKDKIEEVFDEEKSTMKNFCYDLAESLNSKHIDFFTSQDIIKINGCLKSIFDLIDSNDTSFNNKYKNLLKQFDEIFNENKTQPNHSTNGSTKPAAINTLATTKNNGSVINGKDKGVPKTSIDSCSNLLGFTISSGIVGISSLLSTLKRKRK